jgi:hypothetical protein
MLLLLHYPRMIFQLPPWLLLHVVLLITAAPALLLLLLLLLVTHQLPTPPCHHIRADP